MKVKPWLHSIERKIFTLNKSDYTLRLDQCERITPFPIDFFNGFLNSITQEDIITYPNNQQLKLNIARVNGVKSENVFLAPGSEQIIKAIFETCVREIDDEVILTNPCFPMYNVYTKLYNANPIEIFYQKNLTTHIHDFIDNITDKTSLITLANPNSPIGDFKTYDEIKELVKFAYYEDIVVLIDEAYYEYAKNTHYKLLFDYPNVCFARTFSKAVGAAGIRLGYLLGHKDLIKYVSKGRIMYELTGLTIKFANYLLDNIYVINEYVEKTIAERKKITNLLINNNYDVVSSRGNGLHFNDNNDNVGANDIFKHASRVSYRNKTIIPYDNRKNGYRLTIGPDLSETSLIKNLFLHKGTK